MCSSRWAVVATLCLGTLAAGCSGGNSGSSQTTINIRPETGAASFPKGLKLPTADDPRQLTNELLSNYQSAVNTNNTQFLDFFLISTAPDGALVSQILDVMRKDANYRKTSPTYHHQVTDTVISSSGFEAGNTQRTITVDAVDDEITQNNVTHTKHDRRLTYTLQKLQRTSPDGSIVDVWLVSAIA